MPRQAETVIDAKFSVPRRPKSEWGYRDLAQFLARARLAMVVGATVIGLICGTITYLLGY